MRENEGIENKGKSKIRRIASLDFQRGLAIWMMVFLHVWNHIYDFSWIDLEQYFKKQTFFLEFGLFSADFLEVGLDISS
ncbi:MAG: heparan-alpha-glucosaminide N-acetyltransferase domain-containing protein [Candidatus Heimdallarchaeum endolithica]|uniref:Heparan-alpha-glucosaminide N-acetyltransferase domain-containing protein n=1 Tax=Candidatus Heimdallarchaeum endolithica TaxID=2876572 RepID=A0A9Y1BRP4_9ARCH|nr:MAG: heparan-alpha-glucosaminide N-acetyltransferase domain-containing protein [Candidatus Heimdallarchaeum endolithica]